MLPELLAGNVGLIAAVGAIVYSLNPRGEYEVGMLTLAALITIHAALGLLRARSRVDSTAVLR